jgi:hypothetical protein
MKADRSAVENGLDKEGSYSTTIGRTTLKIMLRKKGYHIIVNERGAKKPLTWFYRLRSVALDRFEEQCDFYKRA